MSKGMRLAVQVSSSRFGTIATVAGIKISLPSGGTLCLATDSGPTATVRDAKGNTVAAICIPR